MRTTMVLVATALVGVLLGFAADSTSSNTAKKKAAAKSASKSHSSAAHSKATHPTAATGTRKAALKKGKKGAAHSSAAQARQATPTPQRYKEIQEALVSKGYLPPDQATGQWGDGSLSALKRFQADQNLEATGKINSLSLIALGLGPKHETPKPGGFSSAPAPQPQQP